MKLFWIKIILDRSVQNFVTVYRYNFLFAVFVWYLIQILRENKFKETIDSVKIEDGEEMTLEKTTITMKRAARYLSALQTSDGHWPAHIGGGLFFIPLMVSSPIR